MSSIRMAYRLTLIAFVVLAILFSVTVIFPLAGARSCGRMTRMLAGVCVRSLGFRVKLEGSVPDAGAAATGWADSGTGYMVCSNHVSFVDIFVLSTVLPVRFVAKREIASWPVFGFISRRAGTIFIDRSRRRAVLEIAEAMSDAMRHGCNVLFFPEGTTGHGRSLLPFHANLFAAAVSAEAPVLPIVLEYNAPEVVDYVDRNLFDVMKAICRTSDLEVVVRVLPVIASAGRDRREICADASRIMSEALGVPDATAELEVKRRERMASTSTATPMNE